MKLNIDDGFRFGLGLFETILVLDNKAVLLKEHLHRLQESMSYFKIQKHIDEDAFLEFLEKDQKEGKSVLKATVTTENFLLERKDYLYKKEDYQEGFSLKKSFILRNETSPFTYHKTLNYGDNILEKRKAALSNFNEPYFINTKGFFTEGATTNLFFMRDNKIFTPPADSGLLKGILRDWVIDNYSVDEKHISQYDYHKYDEIFLTNSLLGIMPVKSIDGHTLSSMEKSFSLHQEYESFLDTL